MPDNKIKYELVCFGLHCHQYKTYHISWIRFSMDLLKSLKIDLASVLLLLQLTLKNCLHENIL
jgi:hypothetical protein